ncbi:MAG TPA: phage holin family protein [Gaiellaceae bacterium]|nr:phage holin family protein [Gaiellaceae bacterium]
MTETSNGGVGSAAKHVAEHASSIARLEVQLALLEVKQKAAKLGIGIGMLAGAALFGLFLLMFLLAAAAAALTLVLPVWAALLVMAGAILLVAGALAGIGAGLVRKGTPPVPEQAIEEAKLTTEALRAE